VLDREQALEDPVVQARLAELVAVQDRLDALPPLLEKVQQREFAASWSRCSNSWRMPVAR
jgi:hypothetical protein